MARDVFFLPRCDIAGWRAAGGGFRPRRVARPGAEGV